MQRILLTGARAPACLELARLLSRAGKQIFVADSLRFPIAKGSRYVSKTLYIPAPTQGLTEFARHLLRCIVDNKIDLVIPTCEEIFYISLLRARIGQYCEVFCDDFATLAQLHHKYHSMAMLKDLGVETPVTHLLNHHRQIHSYFKDSERWVFKPAYSRFASHALLRPTKTALARLRPSEKLNWIAQHYIDGEECCSYSIADKGRLQAHTCYRPQYRIGQGAGMYFSPIEQETIRDFVSRFVQRHRFTGQVGFDFIQHDSKVTVIECNPRTTSGIHLLADRAGLANAFLGHRQAVTYSDTGQAKMIAVAMLTLGLPYSMNRAGIRRFISDFRQARDVIYVGHDIAALASQILGWFEILYRSVRSGISLRDAAAADIEWNGEPLDEGVEL